MVVGVIRSSAKGVRAFLRKLGISVGACFDDHEITSLLRGINSGSGDYWLLGWRERKLSNDHTDFILTFIGPDDEEYRVRIRMNVGIMSMNIPINSLNLSDELSGVTIMVREGVAHVVGRILCIKDIRVKGLP